MNPRTAIKLVERLQNLEADQVRIRLGEVTDDSPLSVALGGNSTPYTSVKALAGVALAVGDLVAVTLFGRDLLVLGKIGDGADYTAALTSATGGTAGFDATIGQSSYSTVADFGSQTFSGALVRVDFACRLQRDANCNGTKATFACFIDGTQTDPSTGHELMLRVDGGQNNDGDLFNGFWVIQPSAGTHTVTVKGKGDHSAGFFYTGYRRGLLVTPP